MTLTRLYKWEGMHQETGVSSAMMGMGIGENVDVMGNGWVFRRFAMLYVWFIS